MKPLKELTPGDISDMSEGSFTALLLILGPVPLPINDETYMPTEDWRRIEDMLGDVGAFNGSTHTFAKRADKLREWPLDNEVVEGGKQNVEDD